MINLNYSKLEASIGLSRKWNARDAGREVAKSTIKNLKEPPSFFLLFATIHYKEEGGFQEFLDGVWDVLPKNTPLVGGTIAGFINNYGSFTRGATALAVSYPNMDIALGIGKHVKLNPNKAAKICSKMIKRKLKNSKYDSKFLINIISGPTIPFGKFNVIKSKTLGYIVSHIGYKLFSLLGFGVGKEEEIIDQVVRLLPDFSIIGGSALDSGKMLYNYQFIGNQVHTNAIVAIGCNVDLSIFLKSMVGLHKTNKTFEITDLISNGRIIRKINNKPAKEEFLKIIGIIEKQFKDLGPFYYRTSNYFPITFEENPKYTSGVAGFLGDNVALGYKARGEKVRLLSITGREIIDVIDNTFHNFNNEISPFVFLPCSFILANTLGSRAHLIKNQLDEHIKDTPYLMILTVNENAGTPDEPAIARVYSLNTISILNENCDKVNKMFTSLE